MHLFSRVELGHSQFLPGAAWRKGEPPYLQHNHVNFISTLYFQAFNYSGLCMRHIPEEFQAVEVWSPWRMRQDHQSLGMYQRNSPPQTHISAAPAASLKDPPSPPVLPCSGRCSLHPARGEAHTFQPKPGCECWRNTQRQHQQDRNVSQQDFKRKKVWDSESGYPGASWRKMKPFQQLTGISWFIT